MHTSINRRNFIKSSLAVSLLPAINTGVAATPNPTPSVIPPKRLQKGDTIGLVAPASNAYENREIAFATDILKSLGFKVKHGQHLFDRMGYLAGADEDRANDVNEMFTDRSVDGIFCLRGGYGTPRILPYLKYRKIRANPKPLVGYSDITALHQAIFTKSGLICFHGPIAKQNFSEYTLAEFKKVIMNPSERTIIGSPPPFEAVEGQAELDNRITHLYDGKARGRIIGGNLSLMVKLVGTPYEPNYKGKILVLEEVGEKPYRVDGMLTHLWLAGRLQKLAGLVFGKFTDCYPDKNSLSLEEVFTHRAKELKIPTLWGLMMGHVKDQTTIPIGAMAELDVEAGTLSLTEPAVR